MARPILLSNNEMLVGLNMFGLVHDFYYPYVGLENHASAASLRHKIGVWVEGQFSWLDDDSWQIDHTYLPGSLISNVTASNSKLDIVLEFHDFVAVNVNCFIRNVHVVNKTERQREVRLFFHQVFQISESTRGDTAMYVPEKQAILDYKDKRAFAIYAESQDDQPFDQYSIGNFGIEGKQGTYIDAEDGILEGNEIEHGQVDSVIRVACQLKPNSSARANYWITAGLTNADALKLHEQVRQKGVQYYLDEATRHWHDWIKPALKTFKNYDATDKKEIIKQALLIKSHIDKRGAVIASCDSQMLNYARDYYSYCWPRDSAFIMMPLIDMGYKEEPRVFFKFMEETLDEAGYFHNKYLSDGSIGSSWHPAIQRHHSELPIQEDATAVVLYALEHYLKKSKDDTFVGNLYEGLIQPAGRFMAEFIDEATRLPHASYDLWEERFQTTTYTTAAVYAGLVSASNMAEKFGYPDDAINFSTVAEDIKRKAQQFLVNPDTKILRRGYYLTYGGEFEYDDTLDTASLFGALEFGLFEADDEVILNTLKAIDENLVNKAPVGGVPRYQNDHYHSPSAAYGGNPWILTTLWMAKVYLRLGDKQKAQELFNWVMERQLKSGVLPEQVTAETGEYISVAPLIWSQAEAIDTLKRLRGK